MQRTDRAASREACAEPGNRSSRSEWLRLALVLVLLAVATVALRLILLQLPEAGGDARSNWAAAHRLLYGGHEVLSLSYSRLGIQIPTALAIAVLGSHPLVYHVVPIAMSVAVVFGVFALIRRHAGPGPAVLGAVVAMVFPGLEREGVQLLPGAFSCAALVLILLALSRLLERPASLGRLAVLGLCLFFAYLIKFSDLFVLPGVLVALVAGGVPRRHVALLLAGLALLYGFEHAFFAAHGWPWGQFQMLLADGAIQAQPPAYRALYEVHRLGDFFRRYSLSELGADWYCLYWLFALSAAAIVAVGRRPVKLCLLAIASHLIINTFALQDIDPVMLLTRPIRRYHTIYAGAMIAFAVIAVWQVRRRLLGFVAGRVRDRRLARLFLVAVTVAAVLAIAYPVAEAVRRLPSRIADRRHLLAAGEHALQLSCRYRQLVSTAWRHELPILAAWQDHKELGAVDILYRERTGNWSRSSAVGMRKVDIAGQKFRMLSALPKREARSQLEAMDPDDEVIWVRRGRPYNVSRRRLRDVIASSPPP